MTENGASSSPDPQTASDQAAPTTPTKPRRPKKTKSQPVLVWLGIVCLLVAAFVGWRTADRKKRFQLVANRLDDPVIREPQVLKDWAKELRQNGGVTCQAIAEMLTAGEVPPLLQGYKVADLDSLSAAVRQGGPLYPICEKELIGTLNTAAWALALIGIGLILLDILREKGVLGGKKR